ncbi:capsular exopolysaccharide family [Sphingomonas guangdongensis]|uniref:non-specific protein-tyrosine kinase n=1 Tax=Sphingomonas guangdongensis TaxID=1141890 RepID=A0A285QFD2_9SPHN|nr:polysaccharide biosynthesis tyrosine autokinase [Sphingomonas guangdongensis]SOB80556.1 capsular exopolysaccharide family [Sphingomonas guangdongensis]
MQFPFDGSGAAAVPLAPGSPAAEAQAPRAGGLREIWAAAYRARWWIAGIFALCIALAIVAALLSTRLYQATATVEVRQEAEKVLGTEADREGASSRLDSERFMQTQLDIIRSRGVAEAVAERQGLFRGNGFLDAMRVEVDPTRVPLGMTPRDARREVILDTLAKGMSVRYTGTTRIAQISFTSPDPRLSARVANAFADAYIRSNLARKANSSVYALDFLRDQLREAQARLEQTEQRVVDYARRTRIVDAGNAAGSTASTDNGRPQSLITAQLVQLNQAYSSAVSERIAAEQKWRQIAQIPPLSTPDVLSNSAVQQLIDRRASVEAEYRQQLTTRREDYPTVVAARAQIAELDRQIGAIAGNIRAGVRSAYRIAQARERQLSGEIDALKSGTLAEQNQGIELSILRREADTNRQQYEALLRRFNALNAESGVQTNNLAVVDRASIPDRTSWPKLSLNLALALILGMLLSALVVFLREQLFRRVRTPDEVTAATGLSLLGVVPTSSTPNEDLADPKSFQSDAYSSVRTSLSLLSSNGTPRTIMFTSTQQGEGKSTACRALALSLARLGRRVVLVDVDLRRPNLHRLFEQDNTRGFSNLVTGQTSLEESLRHTPESNVDLIVAGDIPPNPTELMDSPRVRALFAELASRYDVVLIDSAPVLGLADAVILSSEVEATIYIVESGRNAPRMMQTSLSRLKQGGGAMAGAVLLKFDPGRSGYGYGTEYGYSYDYGSRKR